MKELLFIISASIVFSLFMGASTALAGPLSNAPFLVEIDDDSIIEDDPDFFNNPPLWQLKSYSVYPVLQRHKLNKSLKVLKFKAGFEYRGDTMTDDGGERLVIGTAMCKVPDPYYFYDTKIRYKGTFPLEEGKRVSMSVLIPFPNKFSGQLRKNPATCNVSVEDEEGFPVSYSFEVTRVGRQFHMKFMGTNSDRAKPLDDGQNIPEPNPTQGAESGVLHGVKAPPQVTSADHIRGKLDAPITLVEYSDPECPFCQKFHGTMKDILKKYDGKVRWVYRHFPLTELHPNAQEKAEAGECANEVLGSEGFWTVMDQFLENDLSIEDAASTLDANKEAFLSCIQTHRYKNTVYEQMQGGMASDVNGTPTTFLFGPNNRMSLIVGSQPFEAVAAKIEEALK